MNTNFESYEQFSKHMVEKFPSMYADRYGGFDIGQGWYSIVEALSSQIQHHIDWRNDTRKRLLEDNPYNNKIPDEVAQVKVNQVKEKFGGLRFYYDGGDDVIDGMVRMAESWASRTCEECGKPGRSRSGGWIRTLCDEHEAERQQKLKERLG